MKIQQFLLLITCTPVVNSNRVIKLVIDHNLYLFTVTCSKVLDMSLEIIKLLLLYSAIQVYGKKEITERVIAKASNKLDDDLYKLIAKTPGNIGFSPFSAYSALALLSLGASGRTQRELFAKLSLNSVNNLKIQYGTLFKQLTNSNRDVLHIANALFCDSRFSLLDKYKTQANNIFKAKPQKVDFTNAENAANIINNWAANQTDQMIQAVVDDKSLDDETALVLMNVLYFKATWEMPFNKSQTVTDFVFHSTTGDVKCTMMVMSPQKHAFFSNTNFFMLVLPFHNTKIKIAFIKALRFKNITVIEKSLNEKIFFNAVARLRSQRGIIKIPTFTLDVNSDLTQHLKTIGVTSIFRNPDFSNLFRRFSVPVSEINQKIVVEISETGVKAASVTSITERCRSQPPVVKFILDSPFLFFLYDSKSEVVLMRGRIDIPTNL